LTALTPMVRWQCTDLYFVSICRYSGAFSQILNNLFYNKIKINVRTFCESTEKIPRICERYVTFFNSELKSHLIPSKMKYKNISRTTFVILFLNTFGQEFPSYNYGSWHIPPTCDMEYRVEYGSWPTINMEYRFKYGVEGVSEWLWFNANSAIFQLYHGENKLIFNEMMMKSALY
jgi:hypothetical protein